MTVADKPRVRVRTDGTFAPAVPRGPGAAYMRGNEYPFFFNWNPTLRDQREDVRAGYHFATARTIDALQNSGWLAGAVDHAVAATIGNGLRLAARPDTTALGWDDKTATTWVALAERSWVRWSESPVECDAAGLRSIPQMTANVMRSYFSHGEALALLPCIDRPVSQTRTKVQMLPPHRLMQDSNPLMRMWQGVAVDGFGMPRYYRMRSAADAYSTPIDIAARDGAGRPQVIHVFEGREGTTRGITPMAPVLRVVRQFDQLADATLTAALIQTLFAATVESEAPTEEILRALQDRDDAAASVTDPSMLDYLSAKKDWYRETKIDLGGPGRIAHLFPNEKLKFNRSEHPNSTYEQFAKFLLREIARCLGMTFETLTGDYSGATYSSVRMATSEIWPIILYRRQHIGGRFLQHIYEAWMEEAIESGALPFPGGIMAFWANRAAVVQADWKGPAKPQADDYKTAKAHEVYKRLGIMSDERICAEMGFDYEDEYRQRKKEAELRGELILPDGDAMEQDPAEPELVKEPANGGH